MRDKTPTYQLIAQCISSAQRATVSMIQSFLHKGGDTMSVRGVSMALENLEENGVVRRIGMSTYALTILGARIYPPIPVPLVRWERKRKGVGRDRM